jgi:GINS complex subunit 4
VLEELEKAWINEKAAVDILPYKGYVVDSMMLQIQSMEENLQTLKQNDFRYITHKMEIERIRYVLASYLRCRLQKIEQYPLHIMQEENARSEDDKRLSEGEFEFAEEYYKSIENYFKHVAIRHMPQNQQDDENVRKVVPNMNRYVFIKVNKEGEIQIHNSLSFFQLLMYYPFYLSRWPSDKHEGGVY